MATTDIHNARCALNALQSAADGPAQGFKVAPDRSSTYRVLTSRSAKNPIEQPTDR